MNINEFVAKKMGEVLAFADVGNETIEKGKAALILALGEDEVMNLLDKNRIHADEIKKIAQNEGVMDIVLSKIESTGKKLRLMRDVYIAEKWDNTTKLLGWLSFFHGAGAAHWALVRGAAETLDRETLIELAEEAQNFHHEILDTVCSELEEVGQDKADATE